MLFPSLLSREQRITFCWMTLNIHRNAVIVLIFCDAYPIVTIIVSALAKNLAKHLKSDDPRPRCGLLRNFFPSSAEMTRHSRLRGASRGRDRGGAEACSPPHHQQCPLYCCPT